MDRARWDAQVRGENCPLDAPRPRAGAEWDFVAALAVSSLYLLKNQTYRGHCQLVFDPRHAARPDQLSRDEWAAFCADLFAAQGAIVRTVRPDHVNVESLGNVVPHLHWHIVPRTLGDPRWGAPIWPLAPMDGAVSARAAGERERLLEALRRALGS